MRENKNSIYDLVININSILGFKKGWEIQYSPEGKKKAEYAGRNFTKIFSVIGNKDRGKSFILSKIAKRDLPCGFSVTTKGLSISFPSYESNSIALLDSVGFESPLLECDGEDYILKSDNEEDTKAVYEKLNKIKEEIKNLKKNKGKIYDIRDKENEFFRIRNEFRKKLENKEDQIYTLTNERRITDFFLQRFIIENANVLLLVVGKLTIDDQFFLNKLTKLIKENHEQFLQKIIVIHNLMTMKYIDTVEDYIKNTLSKSLTFTIKKKKDLHLNLKEKKQNYNRYRYVEVSEDPNDKEITHLIMAQEGTEAGRYYNESAIEFIRHFGNTVVNSQPFNIIEKLKDYFCKVSETILKFENSNEKKKVEINTEEQSEKIKPNDIQLIQDKEKGEKLKLNYENDLNLETFYGDDLITDTFGDPKFTPKYYIISNDPEYVKIYLDCPGKTEIKDIEIKFPNQQLTTVTIKGKRAKQNNKTLGKKFGSGEFELKIFLKKKDGEINKEATIETIDNGFRLIKLKREAQ
jgi:hypothetical protein